MRALCTLLALLCALPLSAQPWSEPLGTGQSIADFAPQAQEPLSLSRTEDLSFGSLIPNGGGTVTLRPQGNQRRTTGSIVLLTTPPARAAQFYITGAKNAAYTVMLPDSAVLTRNGGSETMTATSFVLKSENSNKIHGSGWDRFTVGATLTVGANQRVGVYTGLWYVTVAYE